MNLSVSYSKFSIHHLAAVAAACSKSVVLYQNNELNGKLSMAPFCEEIQSQNSIICLLLNFNPIDEDISGTLLWEAKYIKPVLYNLSLGKKHEIAIVKNIIDDVVAKFGNRLKPCIMPLELVLWADLYPIFTKQSPLFSNVDCILYDWFNEIDKLEPLRKAAKLLFGEDESVGLNRALKNLPMLPVVMPLHKTVACVPNYANVLTTLLHGHAEVKPPRVFASPKLPLADARNVLITSALPYVNNVPHLGNLIGSTLSADVFSRYCRIRGYNSVYVCGTDEYGTATEVKAVAEGLTPRQICDRYHEIHAEVYRWFGIDFDVFGRTSHDEHTHIVQSVFQDIYRRGFILEDVVQQLYCAQCDKFLADRFVEGGCPVCGYTDARGDQCDKCGKLINAIELVRPRCKLCESTPCVRTSQHLFLDLSKIQGELEVYLNDRMNATDCIWSTNAKSITKAWLNEGLKPRCITRDLKWGVPVPLEEYSNKVFYVWFDAVLGYMSITSRYTEHWQQWWLPQEGAVECNVQLYQFMAKDNVPFHSVILPANLMATGHKYTMLRQLASTEYLNYENEKFSKSRGVGVFGPDAVTSGIPADVWRFYLVSSRPESQDSVFMWDDFAARNNNELLNNLGNFVNRALSFVVKFFEGVIPDYGGHGMDAEVDGHFVAEINDEVARYVECMEQMKMRDAVYALLAVSRLGNGYIQKNKPWLAIKAPETRDRAATVIGIAANVCVTIGVLLCPIMPSVSQQLLGQCNAPSHSRQILDDCQLRGFLRPGHKIGEVVPLFAKMEDSLIDEMKKKFGCATK